MHPRPTLDSNSRPVLERHIIITAVVVAAATVVVISASILRCGIDAVFGYTEMNTSSQAATRHILLPITATCFDYLNVTIIRQQKVIKMEMFT